MAEGAEGEVSASVQGGDIQISLGSDKPERSERVEKSAPIEKERKQSIRSALRSSLREKPEASEPAKPATPSPAPAAREATNVSPAQTPQPAQQFEPIVPPADMSKEEQAEFAKLPPEMQRYLSRRSYQYRTDYTKKTMELSGREKEVSSVLEAVTPHRDVYARQGITPADIVRRSIAWDQAFRQDPHAAAREYLASYGIDPAELVAGEAQQSQQQQNPGYLTREEAEELAAQKARSALEEWHQRQQQESHTRQNLEAVQKFVGSKPLFRDPGTAAQLEEAMSDRVARLRALDPSKPPVELLEEAYEYVTSKVEPFKSLTERLNAKPQIERTNDEGLKAKLASRSISGGPGSGSPTRKPADMRENLRLRMTGGA